MSQTELPPELRRMSERENRLARELAEAVLDGLASGALGEARLSDAEALAEYDALAERFLAMVADGLVVKGATYHDFKRILERRRAGR